MQKVWLLTLCLLLWALPARAQVLPLFADGGTKQFADYAYTPDYACVAEDAAALYRSQAQSAGYQAQTIQAEGFTAFEFTFEGAFKDGSVTYENGSFRAEMHR